MSGKESKVDYKKSGKRYDGRKMNETRPVSIKSGVLKNADGSAYLEWGQNKVYAGVFGPREALPKHSADPNKAVIKVEYRMTSFSVPDRKRPGPNRRDQEISKVLGEALSKAVLVEKFPNTEIGVYVEVTDSDAGSRVACLTAASVALADAGIPMKDLISATGVGKAYNEIILDLNKFEEDAPDAVDVPIAIMPNTEEIVLLQMDGPLTRSEWDKVAKLGIEGCKKVYEIQKKALLDNYSVGKVTEKDLSGKKESEKVVKKKSTAKKATKKKVKK